MAGETPPIKASFIKKISRRRSCTNGDGFTDAERVIKHSTRDVAKDSNYVKKPNSLTLVAGGKQNLLIPPFREKGINVKRVERSRKKSGVERSGDFHELENLPDIDITRTSENDGKAGLEGRKVSACSLIANRNRPFAIAQGLQNQFSHAAAGAAGTASHKSREIENRGSKKRKATSLEQESQDDTNISKRSGEEIVQLEQNQDDEFSLSQLYPAVYYSPEYLMPSDLAGMRKGITPAIHQDVELCGTLEKSLSTNPPRPGRKVLTARQVIENSDFKTARNVTMTSGSRIILKRASSNNKSTGSVYPKAQIGGRRAYLRGQKVIGEIPNHFISGELDTVAGASSSSYVPMENSRLGHHDYTNIR